MFVLFPLFCYITVDATKYIYGLLFTRSTINTENQLKSYSYDYPVSYRYAKNADVVSFIAARFNRDHTRFRRKLTLVILERRRALYGSPERRDGHADLL